MSLELRYPVRSPEASSERFPVVLLQVGRPHQWIKNGLLFLPLLFSHSLMQTSALVAEAWAFCAFCLVSSGVYILNDLYDVESDRLHPDKCDRPIAAGHLSQHAALGLMLILIGAGALLAFQVNTGFQLVLGAYLALNAGYSLGLKNIVILDAMLVALGFVLRAVAGSYAIHVQATYWLVLCTFMVALMVSFGKRYHEITVMKHAACSHRRTLVDYSHRFLEMLVAVCGTTSIVTYALYTTAEGTSARVGSHNLLLTVPFVLFGIFRYMFLLYSNQSGDPTRLFFKDRPTLVSVLGWGATAALVIYGPLSKDLF